MIIYIFLIIAIILLSQILKKHKLAFCISCGLLLFLVIALKDPFLGKSDTLTIYYPAYQKIINNDLSYIFFRYIDESALFYVVSKFISCFSTNISVYYAVLSLPLIIGVSKLIYKHSKLPSLSFLLFVCLNFYFFSFIALKFSVALGIILFALDSFLSGKNKKCFFLIILATLFHYTSIIFLLIFFSKKIKFNKTYLIYILIILLIVCAFKNQIYDFIFSIFKTGRYSAYADRKVTLNLVPFVINYILICFAMLCSSKDSIKKEEFGILWIGTCLSIFTIILAEFIRLSMLFSIISIIVIPNTIASRVKQKELLYIVILVFALFYCFYSIIPNLGLYPYAFFFK